MLAVDKGAPSCSGFRDADAAARVIARPSRVLRVLLGRGASKVRPSVIGPVAVDVVNLVWIFASHPLPDYSMSPEGNVVDPANSITPSRVNTVKRGLSRPAGIPASDASRLPEKCSGFGVVAKALAKVGGVGQFFNSHCEAPFRCGQGRALFHQRFRPAFHTANSQISQAFCSVCVPPSGGGGDAP